MTGRREAPRTKCRTADLGRCLTGSIESVSDVPAVAEGEDFPGFSRFSGLRFSNPLAGE